MIKNDDIRYQNSDYAISIMFGVHSNKKLYQSQSLIDCCDMDSIKETRRQKKEILGRDVS